MVKEITKSNFENRAATKAPRVPQVKGQQSLSSVTLEQRQVMICEAAYYISQHRGFEPGHDMDDWFAAERQIDAALTRPVSSGTSSRLQR